MKKLEIKEIEKIKGGLNVKCGTVGILGVMSSAGVGAGLCGAAILTGAGMHCF
jgi:hypothetical protein